MEEPNQSDDRAALVARIVERYSVPSPAFESLLGEYIKSTGGLSGAEEYLSSKASEYIELRNRVSNLDDDNDREKLSGLIELIENGQFHSVEVGLEELERDLDNKIGSLKTMTAERLFNQGEVSLLNGNHAEALKHFDAAIAMKPGDTQAVLKWQIHAAEAVTNAGERFGDIGLVRDAIQRWDELLEGGQIDSGHPAAVPAHVGRGRAFQVLGELQAETASLSMAVEEFNAALREIAQDDRPREWLQLQRRLGATLRSIGEREANTFVLRQSVDVLREAAASQTAEDYPLDRAALYDELAQTLMKFGEREPGTHALGEAIDVLRAALAIRTPDAYPLAWASSVNNLGNALRFLATREDRTEMLEEAILAYRAALQIYSRDDLPSDWAMVQNNLGSALAVLGQRRDDVESLEAAVTAYKLALEVTTRDRAPFGWALSQNRLGKALQLLGNQHGDIGALREAVAAYSAALDTFASSNLQLEWASTKESIGTTFISLAFRTNDCSMATEAVAALESALDKFTVLAAARHGAEAERALAAARELRDRLCGTA